MKLSTALFILILGLGAFLRFHALGERLPWHDEFLSWRLIDFPLGETIERTGGTATCHPPLYFLFLSLWGKLWGHSEGALRSLSALCGLAAIWGGYRLILALKRHEKQPRPSGENAQGAALLAAALIALNPLQIYMSRQIRGYSLGTSVILWSSVALWHALHERQRSGWYWLAYGVLALAACYTHHLLVLNVVAQGMFVALYLGLTWVRTRHAASEGSDPGNQTGAAEAKPLKYRVIWPLVVGLLLTVAYLPWAPKVGHQVPGQLQQPWRQGFQVADIARGTFLSLAGTPELMVPSSRLQLQAEGNELPEEWEEWTVTGLFGVAFVLMAWLEGGAGRFLFLLGILPAVVLLAYSLQMESRLFYPRYLTFVQVFWLGGLALLVFRISSSAERWLGASFLLAGCIYGCNLSWEMLEPEAAPGLREGMAYILRQRKPDEPVVARTPHLLLQASFFARGEIRPQLCTTDTDRRRHNAAGHLREEDLVTPEQLLATAPSGIWVIGYRDSSSGPPYDWSLPGWTVVAKRSFKQNYPWDSVILVEHYLPTRESASNPQK